MSLDLTSDARAMVSTMSTESNRRSRVAERSYDDRLAGRGAESEGSIHPERQDRPRCRRRNYPLQTGKTLAIIGEWGSGETTMFELISRG
jgi:ABC-type transport system involved in cytochrome bd biosynthesis fused ATPase/permease subunit